MFLLILIPATVAVIIDPSRIKEFKWRGPPVIDETIFTNPNSFDYDFNDDLLKTADINDVYEENVGQLPNFNLYKLGQDRGVTKLPIVTRRMPTWSTVANTRGPLDFFATPSTPVSPVFVTGRETSPRATTTTPVTTTTRRTTQRTTTIPATTTTERTTAATTATWTTRQRFLQREKVVQQPPPVFKTGRGPIWRKGGRIEFEDGTTAAPTTASTATTPSRNTFIAFTRRPLTVPGFFRNFGTRDRFRSRFGTTTVEQTTTTPAPIILRAHQRERTLIHPAPKPVVIHHGPTRYRGPTYNCRVMNPFEDGVASSEHNSNCKMLYPGMSADGSCRCYYKVSGRDEHGCATGFLYACKPIYLHSVVV